MQQAVAEPPKREARAVIARFEFEEERYPLFLSVSSLFTDLLLTHDLAVLLSYPEYADYTFGSPFWTRRGRPIEPEHQLRTVTILKQSPLVLEILVSAVGGIWALTQICDKVANWKLNRRKLELEVGKLVQESAIRETELQQKQMALEESLARRDAIRIYEVLVARLNASEFKLTNLDLLSTQDSERRDKF